jgi:hypothetical protein
MRLRRNFVVYQLVEDEPVDALSLALGRQAILDAC